MAQIYQCSKSIGLILQFVASVLCHSAALADEAEPEWSVRINAAVVTYTPVTKEQIAHWIDLLDDDDFLVRQQAAEDLFSAGDVAVEALIAATNGHGLEVTLGSFEVLRRMARSEQEAVCIAAKAALQKLALSEDKALADRAAASLTPLPQESIAPPFAAKSSKSPIIVGGPGRVVVGPAVVVGGRDGIIVGGTAAEPIRASATLQTSSDGSRTFSVYQDNYFLRLTAGKAGIKIAETRTLDGKETSKTYEAPTADELKEKQPEGYKLYEKYAKYVAPPIVQSLPTPPKGQPYMPTPKDRPAPPRLTPSKSDIVPRASEKPR